MKIKTPETKDPTKSKMGRPRNEIDWAMFENLCAIHCTQSEIANFLKVNVDTLRDNAVKKYEEEFSAIYKKFSDNGKCSLRRYQFVLAKKNTAMSIWLGKQWLGQKDDPSQELEKTNKLVQVLLDEIMEQKRLRLEDQKKISLQEGQQRAIADPARLPESSVQDSV